MKPGGWLTSLSMALCLLTVALALTDCKSASELSRQTKSTGAVADTLLYGDSIIYREYTRNDTVVIHERQVITMHHNNLQSQTDTIRICEEREKGSPFQSLIEKGAKGLEIALVLLGASFVILAICKGYSIIKKTLKT